MTDRELVDGPRHAGRPVLRAPGRSAAGLAAAGAIAVVATLIAHVLPLLGAPVAAIVVGVILSRSLGGREVLKPGIKLSAKPVLQLAVVVLGSQLSLGQVARVGVSSLPVMLGTLAVCLLAAWLFGRMLGIDADLTTLIGVGTAICGASAIAAVNPVVKARHHAVAYAVSTIFCFNIAAVLLFPPLGHLLHLSQNQFGLFAGTAVNDMSSVIATATTYGSAAGDQAVVVKLTRTLMIIPICVALGALVKRRDVRLGVPEQARTPGVPWFLVAFLIVAAINSAGFIPLGAHAGLQQASVFLITAALAGIGLSTDFTALRQTGFKPLLLGAILWIVVATASLLLQLAG